MTTPALQTAATASISLLHSAMENDLRTSLRRNAEFDALRSSLNTLFASVRQVGLAERNTAGKPTLQLSKFDRPVRGRVHPGYPFSSSTLRRLAVSQVMKIAGTGLAAAWHARQVAAALEGPGEMAFGEIAATLKPLLTATAIIPAIRHDGTGFDLLPFFQDEASNWWPSPFVDDSGRRYANVEQYMMARKAALFGDPVAEARILGTDDPAEHKRLGKTVERFDEAVWLQHREQIVHDGVTLKLAQNPHLRHLFIRLPPVTFVEASPYDRIYGIGLGIGHPDLPYEDQWRGTNLLGRIFTKVVAAIRKTA